jgi:hypothetical protein
MTAVIALRVRQPGDGARLIDWKPLDSGSLIGKATIAFASGLTVSNIPVFRGRDGALSAGGPDAPLVDQNGIQLRDAGGKRRYTKVISFENREARERWNRAVLTALRDAGIAGAAP